MGSMSSSSQVDADLMEGNRTTGNPWNLSAIRSDQDVRAQRTPSISSVDRNTSDEITQVIFVEDGNRLIARAITRSRYQQQDEQSRDVATPIHHIRPPSIIPDNSSHEITQVIFVEVGNRLIARKITRSRYHQQEEQPARDEVIPIRQDHPMNTRVTLSENLSMIYSLHSVSEQERDLLIQEDKICSICYEDYSIAMRVMRLPCGHSFHRECLGQWIETHRSCPDCRRMLKLF